MSYRPSSRRRLRSPEEIQQGGLSRKLSELRQVLLPFLSLAYSEWTAQGAIDSQDSLGIKTSVLSVTSPGKSPAFSAVLPDRAKADPVTGCLFLDDEGNQKLARACNDFSAKARKDYPGRFGFYGNLPNLKTDLKSCLSEVEYALDTLQADGICLMTQYDGHYLGHPECVPVLPFALVVSCFD